MNENDAETIYDLRNKANRFLLSGNVEDFNRIQSEISRLQQEADTVIGAKEGEKA